MNKYFNKITTLAFVLLFFAACKKNEANIIYSGQGVAPVLSSNVANNDTIPLLSADSLNTALALTWTNPNYTFSNGISSLNVNYTLQIDTAGSNFTNPNLVQITIQSNLGDSLTVGQLNNQLGNYLFLQTGVSHDVQIRVESFLNQSSLPLYSNALNYVVTPYSPPPLVIPPSSGTLFLIGSATAGAWTQPVPVPNQQFTQISSTLYTITIPLIGGQAYDFLPVNGSWNQKYAVPDATVPNLNEGGGFLSYTSGGKDIPGPSATGTYKIDVNFQTGMFTVTQQ
jgi:starch-binding outer membrane protein SusE/F